MSIALEFRKRLLEREAQERAARAAAAKEGFVAGPANDRESTAVNRGRVLRALLIAAAVLAVFNSGSLLHYTRGLAETAPGRHAYAMSERWHRLMESGRATRLVEEIRDIVAAVRDSNWSDLGPIVGQGERQPAAAGIPPAAMKRTASGKAR